MDQTSRQCDNDTMEENKDFFWRAIVMFNDILVVQGHPRLNQREIDFLHNAMLQNAFLQVSGSKASRENKFLMIHKLAAEVRPEIFSSSSNKKINN